MIVRVDEMTFGVHVTGLNKAIPNYCWEQVTDALSNPLEYAHIHSLLGNPKHISINYSELHSAEMKGGDHLNKEWEMDFRMSIKVKGEYYYLRHLLRMVIAQSCASVISHQVTLKDNDGHELGTSGQPSKEPTCIILQAK